GRITLTSGELVISNSLSINGPGAKLLTISGNTNSRVFHVAPQGTVDIYGLTITGGRVVGATPASPYLPGESVCGGGILNEGFLRLYDCSIASNSVAGGNGRHGDDAGWSQDNGAVP